MASLLRPLAGSLSRARGVRALTVVRTVNEWRALRPSMGKLGFVPTMGNLHQGHVSLAEMSLAECETTAVSIFVNPSQFAAHEDLDRYPVTPESDLEKLDRVGVKYVFMPSIREMYPSGITQQLDRQVGAFVELAGFMHQMEGSVRPHFFRGVATVVCKLFNAIQPDVAYFGQKDAQQCVVVRRMVRDLLMPIEVKIGETLRDPDGLAMSSRNSYLTPEQREAGLVLFRALSAAEALFEKGERRRSALVPTAEGVVKGEPRVQLQYISMSHPETLDELDEVGSDGAILSGAIGVGSTRLIDNLVLKK